MLMTGEGPRRSGFSYKCKSALPSDNGGEALNMTMTPRGAKVEVVGPLVRVASRNRQ